LTALKYSKEYFLLTFNISLKYWHQALHGILSISFDRRLKGFVDRNSSGYFLHLLYATRSCCEKCNYRPSGTQELAVSARQLGSVAQFVTALHRNRRFDSYQRAYSCIFLQLNCSWLSQIYKIYTRNFHLQNPSPSVTCIQRERLLGIAKTLMNLFAIPSILSRSYSTFTFPALLGDNLNLIETAVYSGCIRMIMKIQSTLVVIML
jgi:hypothetical protein